MQATTPRIKHVKQIAIPSPQRLTKAHGTLPKALNSLHSSSQPRPTFTSLGRINRSRDEGDCTSSDKLCCAAPRNSKASRRFIRPRLTRKPERLSRVGSLATCDARAIGRPNIDINHSEWTTKTVHVEVTGTVTSDNSFGFRDYWSRMVFKDISGPYNINNGQHCAGLRAQLLIRPLGIHSIQPY